MRIAIIGCGVGGMSAAIALARDGHEINLFDRFDAPAAVGAGLLLQPSGLEALAALGLRDEIEGGGARVTSLVGKTPSGRGVLDLSYERWAPNCHGLGVHRATLFNTLFDATKAAGVPVHCGVEIVRIDTPHRPVLIDAEQNSYGPFDLAIVANGAASGLRDALLPKARAPLYPWGAIWTIRPDETGAWDDVPRASLCRGARNDRRSTSRESARHARQARRLVLVAARRQARCLARRGAASVARRYGLVLAESGAAAGWIWRLRGSSLRALSRRAGLAMGCRLNRAARRRGARDVATIRSGRQPRALGRCGPCLRR